MRRGTLSVDGLWYCLCPSSCQFSLRQPFPSFISTRAGPTRCRVSNSAPDAVPGLRRYSRVGKSDTTQRRGARERLSRNKTGVSVPSKQSSPRAQDVQQNGDQRRFRIAWYISRAPIAGWPIDLVQRSTEDLENLLQRKTSESPRMLAVSAILRILLKSRHVKPELRHYKAMILANTDPKFGSPENVRLLLNEMEEVGIAADSSTLHAALQALAVHPDYLLRQEILRTLRDRWLPLSPAGWHHLVAGLIREQQFELALDHLDHMAQMGIPVQSWLHGLLVYHLCELEEFDLVLKLMRSRANQQQDISMDLWLYVLDVASEALHHETTRYVWKQVVELGYLNPSYGVCSNILTVASRTGDTELAASVIRFLIKTEVPLSLEDYEKLVETHVMNGDLPAAFETICCMHSDGIQLEESSTRSILTYMVRKKVKPREAWETLKRLRTQGRNVPVGCANVVIEYCEHHLPCDHTTVDKAIKFYKELYALCPSGPDVTTFNCLISLCRRAKRSDACMFAAKEMSKLGVPPDTTTFEHLILMCLELGNFRSAYMYFQDLQGRGWTLSDGACAQIRELCQGSEDEFAVEFMSHPMINILG
ncbi:hypothetical protein VTN77DRAFT_4829 [Rasamsonia byssochlamydoides]|uniref:uncharacterized protein n=1 Tax=Rasamsonia byssochlamydoides TaxID=89139 RepID=UPI0037422E8F